MKLYKYAYFNPTDQTVFLDNHDPINTKVYVTTNPNIIMRFATNRANLNPNSITSFNSKIFPEDDVLPTIARLTLSIFDPTKESLNEFEAFEFLFDLCMKEYQLDRKSTRLNSSH